MNSTATQTVEVEKFEHPLPAVPDANKDVSSAKKVLSKLKPSWMSNSNSKPPLTNINVNENPSIRRKSISSDKPAVLSQPPNPERKKTHDDATQVTMASSQHPPPSAVISRRLVEPGADGGASHGQREERLEGDVMTVNVEDYKGLCNEHRQMQVDLDRIRREHAGCIDQLQKKHTDYTEAENDNLVLTLKLAEVKKKHEEEIAQLTQGTQSSSKLKSHNSELKNQLKELQGQLQSTESERNINYNFYAQEMTKTEVLKGQITELKTNYHIALSSFTHLESEHEKEKEAYQRLNQAYNENLQKLGKLQDSAGTILDDESLTKRWIGLRDKIQSWALTYYVGPEKNLWAVMRHTEAYARPNNELLKLSGDCQDLMLKSDDGKGRALIAEAFLWSYLEEMVFDAKPDSFSKGFLWAHNARPDLCRLERFLRPGEGSKEEDLRKFYKWKASTSRLLISRIAPPLDRRRVQVDPDTIEYMCSRVLTVLKDWLVKTENEWTCREELQKILELAIDLDTYIHEQWCQIYPVSRSNGFKDRHGFHFDNYWMEEHSIKNWQLAPNQLVGLLVSPALVRRGTATGDEYNRRTVLVKGRVLPQAFASSTMNWGGR